MNTQNQQSIGRLLDTKEASKYLGLPLYTLRRIFYESSQKKPVPTRIGHRVYFTPEALDQFVTEPVSYTHLTLPTNREV